MPIKTKLYIARGRKKYNAEYGKHDLHGKLHLFKARPEYQPDTGNWQGDAVCEIPDYMYPEIEEEECWETGDLRITDHPKLYLHRDRDRHAEYPKETEEDPGIVGIYYDSLECGTAASRKIGEIPSSLFPEMHENEDLTLHLDLDFESYQKEVKRKWDAIPQYNGEHPEAAEIKDYDRCPYCGEYVDDHADIEPPKDIAFQERINGYTTRLYRRCPHCGKVFYEDFGEEPDCGYY